MASGSLALALILSFFVLIVVFHCSPMEEVYHLYTLKEKKVNPRNPKPSTYAQPEPPVKYSRKALFHRGHIFFAKSAKKRRRVTLMSRRCHADVTPSARHKSGVFPLAARISEAMRSMLSRRTLPKNQCGNKYISPNFFRKKYAETARNFSPAPALGDEAWLADISRRLNKVRHGGLPPLAGEYAAKISGRARLEGVIASSPAQPGGLDFQGAEAMSPSYGFPELRSHLIRMAAPSFASDVASSLARPDKNCPFLLSIRWTYSAYLPKRSG